MMTTSFPARSRTLAALLLAIGSVAAAQEPAAGPPDSSASAAVSTPTDPQPVESAPAPQDASTPGAAAAGAATGTGATRSDERPAPDAAAPAAPTSAPSHSATESAEFTAAYETLARAEASGDPDGLDPVKELFEEEIDAGRNLARAHNGLGRYYLQQHEHAITILESIQKLFNWDHITQARKHFRRATEADPRYVEAWYNWATAGRRAKDDDALREAVAALRRVVALDPHYRDAYRLLAVTLRDLEDPDGAEAALAEWRATPGFSLALANLEEAYIALGIRDQLADGARLYWDGLAAAASDEEVDAYVEDVKVVLSRDETDELAELDAAARRAWLQTWWQAAADRALVSRDERLAEHYRRLAHVERSYALMIPQRRHYSAISAYRPREQSGFDDRGVVYLRHGEPDDVARFTGPNVQRNESWRYRRSEGDLVFHFVSDEDTEDFKLVTSLADALMRNSATLAQNRNSAENAGELFQSRATLDPIYNRLAFQFDPMLLREEEEDVARDVRVGTSTASYVPESPDSLPFYAVPASFRGEGGDAELLLYFGVPTSDLEMPAGARGPRVAYAANMVLEDPDGDEPVTGRATDSLAVELPEAPSRDAGVLIPDVLRVRAAEGEYRYRLRVRDLHSRNTGTLEGDVEIPDFRGFSASSVVLASRVEAAPPGKFSQGPLKVVPLPSQAFREGQPVFVYYEIYGLEPGEDGRVRWRTEYTVRARERKRNIAVRLLGAVGNLVGSGRERGEEVGLAVDSEGEPAERMREHLTLDLNESEPGPYELVVKIEDAVSGRSVERRAPFVLAP
jgi:GWxTD domain-containing protein